MTDSLPHLLTNHILRSTPYHVGRSKVQVTAEWMKVRLEVSSNLVHRHPNVLTVVFTSFCAIHIIGLATQWEKLHKCFNHALSPNQSCRYKCNPRGCNGYTTDSEPLNHQTRSNQLWVTATRCIAQAKDNSSGPQGNT